MYNSIVPPKIRNVVVTVDVGMELSLDRICINNVNAHYDPKRFAAVILRRTSPDVTALVFRSGKIVCTGADTVYDAKQRMRAFIHAIARTEKGISTTELNIPVENIVASSGVPYKINLDLIVEESIHMEDSELSWRTLYNPELFPGLTHNITIDENKNIKIIVFSSGKVNIVGCKTKQQLEKSANFLDNWITKFKRHKPTLF